VRLHTGEFTHLTDLEEELFRNGYGRATHNQTVDECSSWPTVEKLKGD
jgi:hypothetical protein